MLLTHLVESYEFRKNLGYPVLGVRDEIGGDLEKLLKHELWWVRLYALEVVDRNPNLRPKDFAIHEPDTDPYVATRFNEIVKHERADRAVTMPLESFKPVLKTETN